MFIVMTAPRCRFSSSRLTEIKQNNNCAVYKWKRLSDEDEQTPGLLPLQKLHFIFCLSFKERITMNELSHCLVRSY